MSAVTKSWAFRSTHGKDWVTAETIARERVLKYRGEPTGEIYYSVHRPGKRKRMKHVMKRSSPPFFSYIEPGDGGGGDGGESLTHRLFKEAIASIETTELRLGANGDHTIRITHALTEKRFPTENEYYADVFLTFESETPLSMKWSGEVYIEVHNTNAVHAAKQNDLRAARIPVIEVDVPDLFLYPYDDAQTTDSREAQHLEKIKRILEKGFLMGRTVSNPSSIGYLELKLRETGLELVSINSKLQKSEEVEQGLIDQIQGLQKNIERENNKNNRINDELAKAKTEISRISGLNTALQKNLDVSEGKIESLTNWLKIIVSVLIFGILILLLIHYLNNAH